MSATDAWPRRVLIVADRNPFAERAGNAESLHHMAEMLRMIGAEPHLLCLVNIEPPRRRFRMIADYLRPFASVKFPGTLRRGGDFYVLDPRKWFGAQPPAPSSGWRFEHLGPDQLNLARKAVAALEPDLVIANYFNVEEIFEVLPNSLPRAIYTHDNLSMRAAAASNAGLPLDFDGGLLEWEDRVYRRADLCFVHTDVEASHLFSINPRCASIITSFTISTPRVDLATPRDPVALFVGSRNAPNIDGLRWLLDEVWPQVAAAQPLARLRVAGRVCETVADWPERVEPLGLVDDLAAEYARASVSLTPLRFGSGLKIKLVEGLAHGVPGVATLSGAEGVSTAPQDVLCIAADAPGFAAAICAALGDPNPSVKRRAARDFAAAHFGREAAAQRLGEALRTFHAGWIGATTR